MSALDLLIFSHLDCYSMLSSCILQLGGGGKERGECEKECLQAIILEQEEREIEIARKICLQGK